MTFKTFQEKRIAIDVVNEQVKCANLDECLTEKQLVFLTDIELHPHFILRLQRICSPYAYKVSDY